MSFYDWPRRATTQSPFPIPPVQHITLLHRGFLEGNASLLHLQLFSGRRDDWLSNKNRDLKADKRKHDENDKKNVQGCLRCRASRANRRIKHQCNHTRPRTSREDDKRRKEPTTQAINGCRTCARKERAGDNGNKNRNTLRHHSKVRDKMICPQKN